MTAFTGDIPAPKCLTKVGNKICNQPMWHLNNWDDKRKEDLWICSKFPHHRLKIKRVGQNPN